MAINFIPYDELFAHEYQLTYISLNGNIRVGPYTYNVFKHYTATERQKAFQDCAKWLNWQVSEIQEEWELCMYMYQWIIKSPPPFPYEQYTLSDKIFKDSNMSLTLEDLKVEINNDVAYKSLDQKAWEAKIEYRGITQRSQKDFDRLKPMYAKKISDLRERLSGEWDFNVKVSDDGKILKSDADILDAVKQKMDDWYYANAKERRLLDKLAVVLKEEQLRADELVVRTDLHDDAVYYIDFGRADDTGNGLTTATAYKTINKFTTTEIRTPGDIAYLRANVTWLPTADIIFDEDGTIDAYISIIGCDATTNDPWGDASNVKPIIDFQDGDFQFYANGDDFWRLERLDIRQSADAYSGMRFYVASNWYLKDLDFIDQLVSAIRIDGGSIYMTGCTFADIHSTNGQIYFYGGAYGGVIHCHNCTFNHGAGIGSDYVMYNAAGGIAYFTDCSFGVTTQFDDGIFKFRYGGAIYLRNCAYNVGGGVFVDWLSPGGVVYSEDDNATFESQKITTYEGTIARDTATVNGADSSAKMLSNANCSPNSPLILGDRMSGFAKVWATKDVQINISVYACVDSAWDSALTSSEAYARFSYLSNAASAARTEVQSTETISNTAKTWTAFTSGNITPLQTGWVYIWFYLAEFEDASEMIYVDIKPVVS